MNDQAFKAALRASFEDAIAEMGLEAFKATSMFPLSRRIALREVEQAA